MTHPALPEPSWRFADLNGGQKTYINTAQVHFADDVLAKAIRELIQNSLDAHDPNLDPVSLRFTLDEIPPEAIDAEGLLPHLRACQQQFAATHPELAAEYAAAIQTLSQPAIPVLACIDENTQGLKPERWERLILTEGAPGLPNDITPGGQHNIGKNAPFNLSRAKTVFYATRYVSKAAHGRITHWIGKVQAASHPNPENPEETLQHIGYYARHQPEERKWNLPIEPPAIPEQFALNATGAGIFIIGFDLRHRDWKESAIRAVLQNYFAALLWGQLEVTIADPQHAVTINQENLAALIEGYCAPEDNTRHYLQALLTANPEITQPQPLLVDPRQLEVYLKTSDQSRDRLPRTMAHINRRGMLVTDAIRSPEKNPMSPQRTQSLLPWVGVSMAHDEATEQWIRSMEPPAHDAIQPGQLKDPDAVKAARQETYHQRREILRLLQENMESAANAAGDDITELKDLFPELSNLKPGNGATLKTPRRQPGSPRAAETVLLSQEEEDNDEDDAATAGPWQKRQNRRDKKPNGGHQNGGAEADPNPGQNSGATRLPAGSVIKAPRLLSPTPGEIRLSFTMPETSNLQLHLQQAGEQRDRAEPYLRLRAVSGGKTRLNPDRAGFRLEALPGEKVNLRITLQNPPSLYCAYSLIQAHPEEAKA